MTEQSHDHNNVCRCFRCWIQDNFTTVALFGMVVFGLALLVIVMHEKSIPDKDLDWIEGFVAGAFSTWTLSLRTNDNKPAPPAMVGTPVNQAPEPEPPAAPAQPVEIPSEPKPDLPIFANKG